MTRRSLQHVSCSFAASYARGMAMPDVSEAGKSWAPLNREGGQLYGQVCRFVLDEGPASRELFRDFCLSTSVSHSRGVPYVANPKAYKMPSPFFSISYQSSRTLIETAFVLPLDGKTHFPTSLRKQETPVMAPELVVKSEPKRYRWRSEGY